MPLSIILQMTLPILAMVMAPDSVSTTLHFGSFTIAAVTSSASPRLRPLKAVRDIPRSREANEVTSSRSRLSSGTRPSWRPSWNRRVLFMPTPVRILPSPSAAAPAARGRPARRTTMPGMRIDALRRRLDELYLHYDDRFVDPDPLQFVRAQGTAADREVAGLVASALAYGNVKQIKRSIQTVLSAMGDAPAAAVRRLDPRAMAARLRRFRH